MNNHMRSMRAERRATESARAYTKAKVRKQNFIIGSVAIALVAVIAAGFLTFGALSIKPAAANTAPVAISAKVDKAAQSSQSVTRNTLPTVQNDYSVQNAYAQTADVQSYEGQGVQTVQTSEDRIDNISGERVYIDTKRTAPEITGTPLYYYAYGKTSYGFDWDYDTDNGNFVLSCNYNFDQQEYDFCFYGVTPGTANVTLYYFTADDVKVPVDMTIYVDDALNVSMI